jgi:hypothetical protein
MNGQEINSKEDEMEKFSTVDFLMSRVSLEFSRQCPASSRAALDSTRSASSVRSHQTVSAISQCEGLVVAMSLVIVSLLSILVPNAVHAAGEFRSARSSSDLAGCYKRVRFEDDAMESMNKIEPWPAPYQLYCFYEDGDLRSMQSTEPIPESIEDIEQAMSLLPRVQSFRVLVPGVVETHHKAANQTVYWRVSIFRKFVIIGDKMFKEGDVIMTIREKSGEDIYHRFLEKLD